MPDQDGIHVTKLIKGKYPFIKIIGITSFHHEYVMSGMIAAGANSFLSKNLDPSSLERAIELALEDKYFIEIAPNKFEIFTKNEVGWKLKFF